MSLFKTPKPAPVAPPSIPTDDLESDLERIRNASKQTILTSGSGVRNKLLGLYNESNTTLLGQ